MASEVPVVAVVEGDNFPGIEFVDGRDIVMAPIGNTRVLAEKICDLIDDPEAARKVGMGERKFVEENLSSGRIVEKHLQLYQQLVDENSRNS